MPLALRHLRLLRAIPTHSCKVYGSRRSVHMPTANAVQRPEELVQIVDEHNKAVGKATRAEMRAGNLIHRCSFAIVESTQVSYFSIRMELAHFHLTHKTLSPYAFH